ncbi:MAG: bifunctional [glutamate--ammonia ligase]-adenylyl-L-tyrosine phosphorylase/[glutamate--ammonia-ligase] adenylyltransferase, partial [Pseudomonadales bacterium]|nr:bifunctional [glutamate--ammonia ligase]-adenylyl-L-tyrosine phosphorylase/[glutamate--ammonia-ligase] adenylyltransferase [Pseudomonadales bacterium]
PQQLMILAMGKLGAYELNLSSDIDLIFCFPEAGQTKADDSQNSIENQQFFQKLGQNIIRAIDKVMQDGFVFRVDMRLRPWGQSGALALSFDAMELYYEQHGREWERFAMVKARPIAGDLTQGEELMARLRPFVYRRYTDFSAIQALREMKQMINREVQRQGKANDVKLGSGGIREVEFIAQAFQLIHGGRDDNLRQRSLVAVLAYLETAGLLPQGAADDLTKAYWFLRNTEHAIQAMNDQQSQQLPSEPAEMTRLLCYLNFDQLGNFYSALEYHRTTVRHYFEQVVAEDSLQTSAAAHDDWRLAWLADEPSIFTEQLMAMGLQSACVDLLLEFRFCDKLANLQSVSRDRMDRFMPLMLAQLVNSIQADQQFECCKSMHALVQAVMRRSAYLLLLEENPAALKQLMHFAIASPWIMQQMIAQPVLLEELLAHHSLAIVPDVAALKNELRQHALRVAVDDLEEQMQMLRYFKLAHQVHIVAAEVNGSLPLMQVSDYLSWLAEAIMDYVLRLAFEQMVEKYGYPQVDGVAMQQPTFAIIAYGKFGGIELSHSSDLDLVFIYDADDFAQTDGDKSLDNRTFFTRLGQRILHIMNTRTMLGQLYEVDMRLRPSGGKGLLVSSIQAFEKYQRQSAWTWEHQALVRARAVAGDSAIISKFNQVRAAILAQPRQLATLADDVIAMREKMASNLIPTDVRAEDSQLFHLKHSRGGMVDIEFMVQYGVLASSADHPELLKFTDNIRILQTMAELKLISNSVCTQVVEAYQALRSLGHAQALLAKPSVVELAKVVQYRDTILAFWQQLFALPADAAK